MFVRSGLALAAAISVAALISAPAMADVWVPGHTGPGGGWVPGHYAPGPAVVVTPAAPAAVVAPHRVWVDGWRGPEGSAAVMSL